MTDTIAWRGARKAIDRLAQSGGRADQKGIVVGAIGEPGSQQIERPVDHREAVLHVEPVGHEGEPEEHPQPVVGERELPRILDQAALGGLDYYSEYIDRPRFPDSAHQAPFRDFLRVKYAQQQFDVFQKPKDKRRGDSK